MKRCSYGISDIGRVRELNEDHLSTDDQLGLYVVADGVGGHAKGEIASAEAVEAIHGYVAREYAKVAEYVARPSDEKLSLVRRLIESAVQSACFFVYGLAEQDPNHRGMSTTISALLMFGNRCIVAQVGDSRVYCLRGGVIRQLTEDHTLINYKLKRGLISPEEAKSAKGKNVITRAVGHQDYVQVDTILFDVVEGDRFLLCSDGLHGHLGADEIARGIDSGHSLDKAAAWLIKVANERGGKDNITVLLIDVTA